MVKRRLISFPKRSLRIYLKPGRAVGPGARKYARCVYFTRKARAQGPVLRRGHSAGTATGSWAIGSAAGAAAEAGYRLMASRKAATTA